MPSTRLAKKHLREQIANATITSKAIKAQINDLKHQEEELWTKNMKTYKRCYTCFSSYKNNLFWYAIRGCPEFILETVMEDVSQMVVTMPDIDANKSQLAHNVNSARRYLDGKNYQGETLPCSVSFPTW